MKMAVFVANFIKVFWRNDKSLQETKRQNYKGVVDTATRIVKEEGVTAFWRGSSPFVARAMMVGVFQLATMDQFKEMYANLLHQTLDSIPRITQMDIQNNFT